MTNTSADSSWWLINWQTGALVTQQLTKMKMMLAVLAAMMAAAGAFAASATFAASDAHAFVVSSTSVET